MENNSSRSYSVELYGNDLVLLVPATYYRSERDDWNAAIRKLQSFRLEPAQDYDDCLVYLDDTDDGYNRVVLQEMAFQF